MADGLNRVMLFGNLGSDPELRHTSSGEAVLKIRLATGESYLDRNKVRQERTEWHTVTVWGKRASALANILAKGGRVFVEGSIRTSSFEVEGTKRYKTEVVARNIILAGGTTRLRDGGEPSGHAGQEFDGDEPPDTDDIPF